MEHIAPDHAQRVGQYCDHMAVFLNVFRQGIAHQAPAADVAHAGDIGKKVLFHGAVPFCFCWNCITPRPRLQGPAAWAAGPAACSHSQAAVLRHAWGDCEEGMGEGVPSSRSICAKERTVRSPFCPSGGRQNVDRLRPAAWAAGPDLSFIRSRPGGTAPAPGAAAPGRLSRSRSPPLPSCRAPGCRIAPTAGRAPPAGRCPRPCPPP